MVKVNRKRVAELERESIMGIYDAQRTGCHGLKVFRLLLAEPSFLLAFASSRASGKLRIEWDG